MLSKYLLAFPKIVWHIVDLVLVEVLDQGSLIFSPVGFACELRHSHCLNVFQDVNVLIHALHRFLISVVLKLALLPLSFILIDKAATVVFQDPRQDVLDVRVVEFAFLNHSIVEMILSVFHRFDIWILRMLANILFRLGRGRIHFTNQYGLEFESFERIDQKCKESPDKRGEASD